MFKCKLGQIKFSFQYQSIVHGFKKSVKTKVTCELCDESCVSLDHLKNHINQHVQIQKFRCGNCSKQFCSEYSYLNHIREHHHPNYVCVLCDKTLSSKRDLTAHIRLHSRETPHKCGICDKMFIRKDKLTAHAKRHNEKPKPKQKSKCKQLQGTKIVFKCNDSPKEYKSRRYLTMHTRSHIDNSSNVCEYCGQNILRVDHLQRHKSIHKFECTTKQCSCGVCERPIEDSYDGAAQRQNALCKKSFCKKGNIIFHKRTHHAIKV